MTGKPPGSVLIFSRRPIAATGPFANAHARIRIGFPAGRQLGPGKIALLEAIDRTGSIAAAGREMGMSYRRAWLLADAANKLFKRPLVVVTVGGTQGGGTQLTDFGRALIAAYQRVEARTRAAIREELAPFESDLAEFDGDAKS